MRLLIALLCCCLSLPTLAADIPPTTEFKLHNGLDVVVREDHRAPVITVMVWYRVGSVDEPPGRTGISHLLEHMMFKGTKHTGPGQFSRIVARYGGEDNAFTTYDYTAYYQKYEASRLPLALELEADRMHNLTIDPKQFQHERNVVMEERRQRTEDNPNALAYEKFLAIARPGTGYASPVIGWHRDINNITPTMLRQWYHRHYEPNNAVLVIAGDVKPDQARKLVKKYFGGIKAGPKPANLPADPRPVPGQRRLDLKMPVKVPTLFMAWNVPSLRTLKDKNDYYALTMLAGVLDGGMSARFETDLVRKQKVAAGIGASYDGLDRGAGLFNVQGSPTPGHSLTDLEKAVDAEVSRIQKHPPSQDELERVRAQVTADRVYDKDSVFGQAMEIGYLRTLGLDWRLGDEFADRLAKVTPADVQRVAKQYLVPARSAVAHVEVEAQ